MNSCWRFKAAAATRAFRLFFCTLACFNRDFLSQFSIHITFPHRCPTLPALIVLAFIVFVHPSSAQNTKGDQPGKPSREARFKSKTKKTKRPGSTPAKRVAPKGKSKASNAAQGGKPGKPLRPIYRSTPGKEKAWEGNAAGNRVRVRSATGQTRNTYPQRGPYVRTNAKDPQQKWRAVPTSRVKVRSATGRTRNVYPQYGRFVNNPSRKPDKVERAISNQRDIARNQRSASLHKPPRSRRVTPSSASGAYIARKSINPYAGFWNRKQKGERAYTGDISGRRLRTKNYETPRPKVIKPTTTPYYGRKRIGDKPYHGPAAGGHVTATRESRAWKGDISGRKIRGRNFSSRGKPEAGKPVFPLPVRRDRFGDRPYKGIIPGGGYRSATQSGERRPGTTPVQGRAPGIGAKGIDTYQGNIKGRKAFDTQGAGFTGYQKARKPLKGGGSVSGKLWNNQQTPIPGRTPGIGAKGIDTFQGNIKGRKTFADQGIGYSGYIKAKKPVKGGGSVSGKLWNNNEQPIAVRTPDERAARAGRYQGNINVDKKEPSKEVGGFPGKYRQFDLYPDMRDQGEEFTGYTRLSRFKRNYLKNPNQADEAIRKSRPDKTTYEVDGLQVRVKRARYIEKKHFIN